MTNPTEASSITIVGLDGQPTKIVYNYVVFTAEEDGDVAMYYNTDPLTMGQVAKMAARTFLKMWEDVDYPTRNEMMAILGSDFEKGVWQINHE